VNDDWSSKLRSHFPLCERRAYFFAGAQTPLATEVRRAVTDFLNLWEDHVWRYEATEWRLLESSADLLGKILGCDRSRVAAAESTSHALGLAAAMVLARWSRHGQTPGTVVIQRDSHPASSYAWINARRLGSPIEIRWAGPAHGESSADALIQAVDERTIAMVATHVSHRTGERLDVPALAGAFPSRKFALLLDAAQSAGALDLSNETTLCDFIGMPSYKWLFGPPGVGFLVSKTEWLESVGPPLVGWASVQNYSVMDSARMDLRPGAQAMRTGMPNFIGMAAAEAGLKIFADAGPQQICGRIRSLTDRLLSGLVQLGHRSPTPTEWSRRAGVVVVDLPDADASMRRLMTERIDVGVEEGRLRVDPHAYNTEAEIDLLLEHLANEERVAP
jgi:cysteine desulfurase / selenocysteine lyase